MNAQMPVFLYDVTTATDTPRTVVTCRKEVDAQALASRLNAMRVEGLVDDDPFTVAAPRASTATIAIQPGRSVLVDGYHLDVEAVAVAVESERGR